MAVNSPVSAAKMSAFLHAMPRVVRLPATLSNLAQLAATLERIESSTKAPHPEQYQRLVAAVSKELQRHADDPALQLLLDALPASEQIYENLRYGTAGLCRSPLERSVESEQAAREAIQALMRR